MKKFFGIFLCLMLVMLTMVGCDSQNANLTTEKFEGGIADFYVENFTDFKKYQERNYTNIASLQTTQNSKESISSTNEMFEYCFLYLENLSHIVTAVDLYKSSDSQGIYSYSIRGNDFDYVATRLQEITVNSKVYRNINLKLTVSHTDCEFNVRVRTENNIISVLAPVLEIIFNNDDITVTPSETYTLFNLIFDAEKSYLKLDTTESSNYSSFEICRNSSDQILFRENFNNKIMLESIIDTRTTGVKVCISAVKKASNTITCINFNDSNFKFNTFAVGGDASLLQFIFNYDGSKVSENYTNFETAIQSNKDIQKMLSSFILGENSD